MRRLACLIVLLFVVGGPAGAAGESVAELRAANRLLRAEYDLARTKQLYFLLDLNARRLQFRTAGIVLADLPLAGMRMWGHLPASQQRTVKTKMAPFAPQREKIGVAAEADQKGEEKDAAAPPAEAKKAFEIKALEITDMPTHFRLVLDDGLRIAVRPAAEGAAAWREKSHLFFWYLTQPLISNWNFLHDRPYTELHLTLAPKDVQLLYWSLAEGSTLLLDAPARD